MRSLFVLALLAFIPLTSANAANPWGLKKGDIQLQSAGPLTFGPDGVLLVGDPKAATVLAIQTQEKELADDDINISDLDKKVAAAFGTSDNVSIVDLAVNPKSGNAYLSVTAGAESAILFVNGKGEISKMDLSGVEFAKAELADAPEDKETGQGRRRQNPRMESITDLAYAEGKVYISGLKAGDAPSSVRGLVFPFNVDNSATSIEIYHGAHGKHENSSAIRTFVPFNIDGEPNLLAGFVCTPLVKFPVASLSKDTTKATTIAELGNRNRPLDMIVYKKDGADYLLMANSARGVMKISTKDIANSTGITEPVSGGGTAGQEYETIAELKDVSQLEKIDDQRAMIVVKNDSVHELQTILLP